MNDGEADKEMSDSLMNDMANAMRSAGLGDDENIPEQTTDQQDTEADTSTSEPPAKEFTEAVSETESVEDQVNVLLEEGEAHSR